MYDILRTTLITLGKCCSSMLWLFLLTAKQDWLTSWPKFKFKLFGKNLGSRFLSKYAVHMNICMQNVWDMLEGVLISTPSWILKPIIVCSHPENATAVGVHLLSSNISVFTLDILSLLVSRSSRKYFLPILLYPSLHSLPHHSYRSAFM